MTLRFITKASLCLFLLSLVLGPSSAQAESAYEHVIRTRTLRCAYILWPSFMERDPNTGKLSGMNYDIMQAVAESLGLKVEWGPEISAGTQVDTLKTHKADAICSCDGPLETSASLYLAYTEPLIYGPFFAYARRDDARFTAGNTASIDSPDVKIATIDGDASGEAARSLFPKAQQVPLPQMADPSQMMQNVMASKADIVINDDLSMVPFMKNNPGKLKKISEKALFVIPNTFSTLRSEEALNGALSQGIRNVRDRGIEAKIFEKYGIGTRVALYPVATPYPSANNKP